MEGFIVGLLEGFTEGVDVVGLKEGIVLGLYEEVEGGAEVVGFSDRAKLGLYEVTFNEGVGVTGFIVDNIVGK